MGNCKNKIGDTNQICGMEIKWKYPYMKVPEGEKNQALNPDGSAHWPNCRRNPNMTAYGTEEVFEATGKDDELDRDLQIEEEISRNIQYEQESERMAQIKEATVNSKPLTRPEYETAETKYNFDRTYKLVELTISKTRKVSSQTILGLPQYENLTYFIAGKVDCEIGMDFQRLVREKFAEINHAISKEIESDIERFKQK